MLRLVANSRWERILEKKKNIYIYNNTKTFVLRLVVVRAGNCVYFGSRAPSQKNQGAKTTRIEKRGKGRKRKRWEEEGKEGMNPELFLWLPRFTNFWLSNRLNQEAEKESQFLWLPRSTAFWLPKRVS